MKKSPEKIPGQWETFYNKLNLIFHGVVALSLIPFAWVFLETQKGFPQDPILIGGLALVVKVLLIGSTAAILGVSHLVKSRWVHSVIELDSIESRLKRYLKLKLYHYALLEMAGLLGLAGLYLTQDQLFTFVYVLVLFFFSLVRPTFDRVAEEIGVSSGALQSWIKEGDERQSE